MINLKNYNVSCLYWDELNSNWSSAGMNTVGLENFLYKCQSNHLTEFSLGIDSNITILN